MGLAINTFLAPLMKVQRFSIFDFDFDVICSGNPLVLDVLKNKGFQVELVQRTNVNYFTETVLRDSYIN